MLPAAFPNLLANGSQGIAVGMATSIPPHNAAELCDAALSPDLPSPSATSEQLMQFVPGPDLPTGGIIVDTPAAMAETYRTGRGSFRVRARWAQGGSRPRQLAHRRHRDPLFGAEVAPDREDRRAAAGEEAAAARRRARRIRRGHPRRAGAAREDGRSDHPDGIAVQAHRAREPHPDERERARRRQGAEGARASPSACANGSTIAARCWSAARGFRLAAIDRRLEILGGLLIVYLDLDRVIKIIREEDEPKQELMRFFKLTEIQANAILDTRLRSLAQARGDGAQARAEEPAGREGQDRGASGLREGAVEDDFGRDPGGPQDLRAGHALWASAAPPSPKRRTPPTSTSRRP